MKPISLFAGPAQMLGGFLPIQWQEKLEEHTSWYNPQKGVLYSSGLEIACGLGTATLTPLSVNSIAAATLIATEGALRISSLSDYVDGDHKLFGLKGSIVTEFPWYVGKGIYEVLKMTYTLFGDPRNPNHRRKAMDEIYRKD